MTESELPVRMSKLAHAGTTRQTAQIGPFAEQSLTAALRNFTFRSDKIA
jgi:hypothetical protein